MQVFHVYMYNGGQGKVSEWRDKYEAKIVNTVEELRQILIGGENIG